MDAMWILIAALPLIGFLCGFIYKAKTTGDKDIDWEDLRELLSDDEFLDLIKKLIDDVTKEKESDAVPK